MGAERRERTRERGGRCLAGSRNRLRWSGPLGALLAVVGLTLVSLASVPTAVAPAGGTSAGNAVPLAGGSAVARAGPSTASTPTAPFPGLRDASGPPSSPTPLGPSGYHFGNLSDPVAPGGDCYGVWPRGGQAYYTNGCYGHDEPGIQFYSTLPGSGGNVTWNVTLPVSRNSSATQSDLYTAIWFGMTLSDPYAWLDQCFLELQFYPDADWNSGSPVFGHWVGAAVAWQIDAANGYENACFYQPLILSDGSELLMHDGDQVTITMTGWVGDPYGENLTITDGANREVSTVTLYNSAQGYPLDPAYATSAYPNSLQWTPGGELPVSFAFETGHTSAPFPNNNSYGGCSSGPPPSTPRDPAVPCPSYDPGSWVNDTVRPWQIGAPTFFNATARTTPAQVSFTQDLGGSAVIDPLSNGTCTGRDGSAWCSYPWYSYSCTDHAFEFGATDYATTSADFGGFQEYSTSSVRNALRLGFYPPGNFSIPTCGSPSYTVSVGPTTAGAGSVVFLGHGSSATRTEPGLAAGEYPVTAVAPPGESFARWQATGSVRVSDAASPDTTLWVTGNGTLGAQFATGPAPTTRINVTVSPASGGVVVLPSLYYTNGTPVATLGNGTSVAVAPGTYSIQAYPPSGYNFSSWSLSGAGASVAAPAFVYTWLVVPSNSSGIYLTATFVASGSKDTVYYGTSSGQGKVSFDGSSASTYASATVAVGTYALVAVPSSGWALKSWYVSSSGVLSDFSATTNLTLEEGTTYYAYATFSSVVRLAANPTAGGAVSLNGGAPSANQSAYLTPGTYPVLPIPAAGYAFQGWHAATPANEWVYPAGGGTYDLEVNASGNVTATFATASTVSVSFQIVPAGAGTIEFNYGAYANGSVNDTLSAGTFPVTVQAAGGSNFTGWNLSGSLTWTSAGLLDVGASGGTLTAAFASAAYPVSIVTTPSLGASVTLTGGSFGNATPTFADGATVWAGGKGLTATADLANGTAFLSWTTSPGLSAGAATPTALAVLGPGTLTLFVAGFTVSATAAPTTVDLGQSVAFDALVGGSGGFSYLWQGLPTGCASVDQAALSCTPSAVGTFPVSVTVTASDGTRLTASAGAVAVVPALALGGLAATPAVLTLGTGFNLTAAASGGAPPLTYSWGGLPPACPTPDAATLACQPAAAGVYYVTLTIGDAAGASVTASATVTVNAAPVLAAFSVSPGATDVGFPVVLTAAGEYGTGPLTYAYLGLPPGCTGANVTTLSCLPTASGSFSVVAQVTDRDGFSSSLRQNLTVAPLPAIAAFGDVGWSGVVNRTLPLSTEVSGGTPPLTFHYTGLPGGCASQNATAFHCVPTTVGHFTVLVVVTDALGATAAAFLNVSVAAAATHPSPGPTPTPTGFLGLSALDWGLVGVAAAGVVGVGIAYRLRRRGRPPRTEPGRPAPVPADVPDPTTGP